MVRPFFFGMLRNVLFYCVLILCAAPQLTFAADLNFSPTTGTYPSGTEFSVQLKIDPSGEKVNASDGKIAFDPETLSVSSISKDGSVFSLWTADPGFSNSEGTINYSGGTPSAFSSPGTILTIKFKAKKVGSGAVSISSGTVLAADGKGTNVFKDGGKATYTIGESAPVEAPAEAPADSGGSDGITPIAPVVTSGTHSKPDSWYATSTAEFAWKPTSDVTAIRTLFSDKSDALPASLINQKLALTQKVAANKDGIWFFYVQYKNDFGWGEITKKQVQIDTVPPEEFEVTLKADGADATAPKLAFSATDSLSGVDRYEIIFGSTSVATIKTAELVDGAMAIPPQEGGTVSVTVKAFDKAGNIRASEKTLVIPAVAKPKPKDTDVVPVQNNSLFSVERILLLIFVLIIGIISTSNYYARKRAQEEKAKLLTAVLELRDKNDKVFSAMREEFEIMVNEFDERPQLSPKERDFLENIKEVLDISEEVLDTAVEELKKKVRGS